MPSPMRSPLVARDVNAQSEKISILKLVQEIETIEASARASQLVAEEKAGLEYAEKLVVEMQDEQTARRLALAEQKEHRAYMMEKQDADEKSEVAARSIDWEEKTDHWEREYDRDVDNWVAEMKGESKLIVEQKREIKLMVQDYKELRTEWKKAKFRPTINRAAPHNMKLSLGLRDALSTSLSVEPDKKIVVVEVTAKEIEIPLALMDKIGALNMKPIKFCAHLSFNNSPADWNELTVRHVYDKDKNVLQILIESEDETVQWGGEEIFVVYKNSTSWFGW